MRGSRSSLIATLVAPTLSTVACADGDDDVDLYDVDLFDTPDVAPTRPAYADPALDLDDSFRIACDD